MSSDNAQASGQPPNTGRRIGRVVGLMIGWLLVVAGFAAWCFVFPQTVRGYEGFGVEKGLITLWICVYGFSAGIGAVTLLGVLGGDRLLPRTVLGSYLVLLATVIISAMVGAE